MSSILRAFLSMLAVATATSLATPVSIAWTSRPATGRKVDFGVEFGKTRIGW